MLRVQHAGGGLPLLAVRFFIVYELDEAQRAAVVGALQAWLGAGLVRHAVAARMPLAECAAAHDAVERFKLPEAVAAGLEAQTDEAPPQEAETPDLDGASARSAPSSR